MRIFVRADASSTIGYGHVMRCLTLAGALRERSAEVTFISRDYPGNLGDLVEARGFGVHRLPAEGEDNWERDAAQTRVAIQAAGAPPDWLIVDHYAADHEWESALRPSIRQIAVIDDLANRRHDCDLLLDQNIVSRMHTRYGDKVPPGCTQLIGPEYALLAPVFAELHGRVRPRKGLVKRILLSYGGAESTTLATRTLSAFLGLDRPDIHVDVVVAGTDRGASALESLAAGHGNVRLHRALPTLVPLMEQADLAIGASGATTWERLCLKLYALVVTMAGHQRPIAEAVQQRGWIRWIGHKDDVSDEAIALALHEAVATPIPELWANGEPEIVDGRGVDRVCKYLWEKADD